MADVVPPGERDFHPAFEYDGTLGPLYRIFLLNLLWTVLTIGIYRFWGVTKFRRYAWAHMRFQGERFAYTGTGGEMFKGALLAGLVLAAIAAAFVGLEIGLHVPQSAVGGVQSLVFGWLVLAAGFAAQRYRLSRTAWRGIRGGMGPGALAYGGFALKQVMLSSVTLGVYAPVATVRMARRRIDAASFGNLPFHCTARATTLYAVFWKLVAGIVLLGAGLGVVGFVATGAAGPDGSSEIKSLLPILYGAEVVIFMIALLLALSFYEAASRRVIESATSLGNLRFRNVVTGFDLAWLRLGNTLILLLTLGFGYPIVLQRRLRLTARTVQVCGELNGAMLLQNTQVAPSTGEGLLSQLDPSGAF